MSTHVPYLRPVAKETAERPLQSHGRREYQAPPAKVLADIVREVGNRERPLPYSPDLAEIAAQYRATDKLPDTPSNKLVAKPKNDQFRMFPQKCREALSLASPDARLVFWALWDQYEEKRARANGLLFATIDLLQLETGIGRRSDVSRSLLELEARGLIRICRGRAGGGRSYSNLALLTAFPDALGNPPTADYERLGLPVWSVAGDRSERARDNGSIASRFNATIDKHIELLRYVRNVKGERA